MRTMTHRRAFFVVLALSSAFGACASGSGGSGGTGAPRSSATRLVEGDLMQDPALDLYSVIQRQRPRWLQNRAPSSALGRQATAVFVDGVRQEGGLDFLRSLRAGDVREVRFLNARDATTRYGTDMTGGALEVETKR